MTDDFRGQEHAIVVLAEAVVPMDDRTIDQGSGEIDQQDVLLGGIGEYLEKGIANTTEKEARFFVLGNLQRADSPITLDRLLSMHVGATAFRLIDEKKFETKDKN